MKNSDAKGGRRPHRLAAVLALALAALLLVGLGLLALERGAGGNTPGGMAKEQTGAQNGPGQNGVAGYADAAAYGAALVREPVAPTEDTPPDDGFMEGMEAFGCQTAALLLAGGEGNGSYSPTSLYFALAALANGAEGETLDGLLALLGAQDLAALNQNSARLLARLQRERETYTLDVASSLWLDKGFAFDEAYTDAVADSLNAWLFEVDFASGEADRYSAGWVRDKTRGTLAPGFGAEPDTVLRILNTVYFKAAWRDGFYVDGTEPEAFALQSGQEQYVDFMKQRIAESSYVQGDGYVNYGKSLYGATMRFVLPDEGVDIEEFFADPALLARALGGGGQTPADVVFWLPKFTFASSHELTGPLHQMGLGQLLQEGSGLSGIAASGQDVAVNSALQETYISIDEEGVEASAYTAIDAEPAEAAPEEKELLPLVEIKLTRPFIYCITGSDGAILFIGVVRNPAA